MSYLRPGCGAHGCVDVGGEIDHLPECTPHRPEGRVMSHQPTYNTDQPTKSDREALSALRWVADCNRGARDWFVLGYDPDDDPGYGPRVRMIVGNIGDPETTARQVVAALAERSADGCQR